LQDGHYDNQDNYEKKKPGVGLRSRTNDDVIVLRTKDVDVASKRREGDLKNEEALMKMQVDVEKEEHRVEQEGKELSIDITTRPAPAFHDQEIEDHDDEAVVEHDEKMKEEEQDDHAEVSLLVVDRSTKEIKMMIEKNRSPENYDFSMNEFDLDASASKKSQLLRTSSLSTPST
ncbi:unnamed protein product, partial [Amoebophrya sp. A25]